MEVRYGIGIEEAEFMIADYLQIKGYKLCANFNDEGKSEHVSYNENSYQFIAFADNSSIEKSEDATKKVT